MSLVRNLVIGFALLFAAVLVAGMLMPGRFEVERAATIAAPPDSVFARFATPRTWSSWSAWSPAADSTVRFTYDGPASGAGARMTWTGRQMGTGTLRLTDAVAPSSVRYEVRIEGTPVVVRGSVSLTPDGEGTRVTWRDEGEVGRNPVMRLLLPALRGSMGHAFEIGFRGLRRELDVAGASPHAGGVG